MKFNLEKIAWIFAAGILVLGYYCITGRYERGIAQATDESQSYYAKTLSDRRLIAQSGRISALHEHIRSSLRGVLLGKNTTETMAGFLRDADGVARDCQSRILSVAPETLAKTEGALQSSALDLSVRGHFADLLQFIARLPHRHVLLKISKVQFAASGPRGDRSSRPLLDSKIHVLIYRVVDPVTLGEL